MARHHPLVLFAVAVLAAAATSGCGGGDDEASSADGATTTSAEGTATTTTAMAAPTGPVVVAHRGASAYAPEHTFAAYDLALDQGADYLEQDLQLTADGVLVVVHDDTLDRTARGPVESCTGPVADKTLDQLRECEVGSWFGEANPDRAAPAFAEERIPTMEEVLDRYGTGVRYYIEIKAPDASPGMEQALLDVLDGAGLGEPANDSRPVLVQSFSADSLRRLHELRPDLPLVQLLPLGGAPVDGAGLDAIAEYAVAIGPAFADVDQALVDAAHERCLEVHPYTVDAPEVMTGLLDLGADGFFTNAPDVGLRQVAGRDAPRPDCPRDG
jgi:glycerophosphoryl diester phosphodiesterase